MGTTAQWSSTSSIGRTTPDIPHDDSGFRDPGFSEEITQEAFYRAPATMAKVSKLNRPDAWTMVVALNCGRDSSRRRKLHEAKEPLLAQGASEATQPRGGD